MAKHMEVLNSSKFLPAVDRFTFHGVTAIPPNSVLFRLMLNVCHTITLYLQYVFVQAVTIVLPNSDYFLWQNCS